MSLPLCMFNLIASWMLMVAKCYYGASTLAETASCRTPTAARNIPRTFPITVKCPSSADPSPGSGRHASRAPAPLGL
jgi:hypothetical protein